jgi:hypothetical protein
MGAIPGAKSAVVPITFSGSSTYTLTSSYVASDAIDISFAKRLTIYPEYSAGATETLNNLDFVVEVNPLDSTADSTGLYWAQVGQYSNAAGTNTELANKFLVLQGTPGTYRAGVPIDFTNLNAAQIRIKAKENGVSANYGSMRMFLVKSDIS